MSAVRPWRSRAGGAAPVAGRIVHVDVRYRSANALLMAYAWRMARGELFLEASRPLPVGTRLRLRLHAPGAAALCLDGVVDWTRTAAIGPGFPAGAAIALSTLIEEQGAIIDELAAGFRTVRARVACAAQNTRGTVARYLRAILTCEIIEGGGSWATGPGPGGGGDGGGSGDGALDLLISDLDDQRLPEGSPMSGWTKAEAQADVPWIVLASRERDRATAALQGADEVLPKPLLFSEFRAAVMHLLSAPLAFTARALPDSTG